MGHASHLGIDLREYDARIRTFIPGYDAMLELAASALATTVVARSPVIVDLGIGTGSLAAACLSAKRSARIIGVDEDEGMLAAASQRLGRRFVPLQGSFETVDLPRCDVFTASFALHHIPTAARRSRLFRRLHRALARQGMVIIADCYLASAPSIQADDHTAWLKHLQRSYTARESRGYLRAWAKEDFYAQLSDEVRLLQRAGFTVDVVGRDASFAVLAASKGAS